jgi:hypothetical protein
MKLNRAFLLAGIFSTVPVAVNAQPDICQRVLAASTRNLRVAAAKNKVSLVKDSDLQKEALRVSARVAQSKNGWSYEYGNQQDSEREGTIALNYSYGYLGNYDRGFTNSSDDANELSTIFEYLTLNSLQKNRPARYGLAFVERNGRCFGALIFAQPQFYND